ncbi:MAG TPA: GH1 family beta-glucosidase, partial [Telluria sp.]|nr:GH1 family beta-glucosidase [Telluria sp.]
WGVATSAFQIEGAAADDGRGPSIWDTFSHTRGKIADGTNGDVACDHYHRMEADVDLIAGLNVNAYRFSISWPRVQPDGSGAWNEAGFAFYERLLDALERKGIAAHLTLYHWDLPQALQDRGGWISRDTAHYFAAYAAEVARRFGHRVATIATHNEPWCTADLGHGIGKFAPGMRDPAVAVLVSHHVLLSHGLALRAMREQGCPAQLGIVLNQWTAVPATDSAADRAAAAIDYAKGVAWYMDALFKGRYPELALRHVDTSLLRIMPGDFELISQPLDFLGVNYYTRSFVSTETPPRKAPAALGVNDMGWEIYPQGLTDLLVGLHKAYRLPPVYITENGIAVADRLQNGEVNDQSRVDYLHLHLSALADAIAQGADVRGYFYWSLMDNFEWDSGYARRFGIVYVDYPTQTRVVKRSGIWYREFIAAQKKLV